MSGRWHTLARSWRLILLALAVLALAWMGRSFVRSDRLTYSHLYLSDNRDVKAMYEAQIVRGRLVLSVRKVSRDWPSAEVAARFLEERREQERGKPKFRWHVEPAMEQSRHPILAPIAGFESARFLSTMVHVFNGVELPAHDDNHFVGLPLWIIVLALAMPFVMKAINDRQPRREGSEAVAKA